MIFLDYSVLTSDISALAATPTSVNDITSIEITNAKYDDLYATNDVTSDYIDTVDIPEEWDFNTILHAEFNDSLVAGNMDFTLESVSAILIKRKKADEFTWTTLEYHEVNTLEDFSITFVDKTASMSYDYQYAIVPILNGTEGNYSISEVNTTSSRLVILDGDALWSTPIYNTYELNRVYPTGVIETLNNKYPTIVRNGESNYDQLTLSGSWIPSNESDCDLLIDKDYDGLRIKYEKAFADFLTNDNVKIIKYPDGFTLVGFLTTPPSNVATDDFNNYRTVSFGFTEIGDINDEEVLYDAGLISVDPKWW